MLKQVSSKTLKSASLGPQCFTCFTSLCFPSAINCSPPFYCLNFDGFKDLLHVWSSGCIVEDFEIIPKTVSKWTQIHHRDAKLLDLLIPTNLLLLVRAVYHYYLSVMLQNWFHWLSGYDMGSSQTTFTLFLTHTCPWLAKLEHSEKKKALINVLHQNLLHISTGKIIWFIPPPGCSVFVPSR